MKSTLMSLGFAALLLSACSPSTPRDAASGSADLIIHGGPILTMEGDTPTYAEAIAVQDGRILLVGSEAEVMRLKAPDTMVKDLGGKLLMPGFIDPHSHFIDSLSLADRVNVSAPPVGPANNPDEIVAALVAAAKARGLKPGELFLGYGYDENLMPAGTALSREALDKAFPDNPVAVIHVSMHGAVLNSKAFAKFGYKDGMPTPEGGVILRKPGTQVLQGLVMEMGYMPMFSQMPTITPETEMAAAKAGQMLYAAAGVTTAQEGATHGPQLAQLQRVAKNDGLFIDVVAFPFLTDIPKIIETSPFSSWGKYENRLKIGGCKITADGSPQGKTAWFTTPYLTGGPAGETDWKGEPGLPEKVMQDGARACYDANVQVLFHANGDAAVDFLLATHAAAAAGDVAKDRRTVCIHCQFVRADQLEKLKAYNIIPSLFTDHTFFFADTHIRNRGRAQTDGISPMKSAIALGLKPTNHSDAFVVPIDQMMTVWTAVSRTSRNGELIGGAERITPYQALQAITVNAAHQYREEDAKGSLAVGKLADLVVLSADPNKVPVDGIKDIRVVETIKEGRTVFPAR